MAEKEKLKSLIITDTAGKAKALKKFVGSRYSVISTDGFLKDLPKTKIGIDENFMPEYITVRGKGTILQELKRETLKARRIFFAMNPDDEGEFFAWQCCEIFGVNEKSHCRLFFDELTKSTIKNALENARAIDKNLVNAFQARQIIDKFISHKIGEYLSCKIYRGVKVGRFRALLLKMIADAQPAGSFDFAKKFTPEVLQELALQNLNFSSTKTRLILDQFYEGLSLEKNNFCGLIKFPRGEEIILSSEKFLPESIKDFLTNSQFKLYDLICKKISGGELENKFVLGGECTEKSLMAKFDALKIDWSNFYSVGINSLIKRGYIVKENEIFKITELGENILNALKNFFDDIFSAETYKKIAEQIAEIRAGNIDKNLVIKNFLTDFEKCFDAAMKSLGENPQPKDEPVVESDEICDKCGRKMLVKRGRFGKFLACSGFPECKNTKPLLNYLPQKCPQCGGRLTLRDYKGKRIFYSCENFQTCNFNTWDEPQEKVCRECGSTMFLHRFKDRAPMLYCGNENCTTRSNHPINNIIAESQKRYEQKKLRRKKISEKN